MAISHLYLLFLQQFVYLRKIGQSVTRIGEITQIMS